jgi:arsenate reductase (thioredoxin)
MERGNLANPKPQAGISRNAGAERVFHILFLSRRNSARSLFAEAFLNKAGGGRFHGASAGVEPAERPEALTLDVLRVAGYPAEDLRPKHVSEFSGPAARDLDFVFTLCDFAAGEPLPEWPGQPVTAQWSSSDPVLVEGETWERRRAFARSLAELERRLRIFISLPLESLDRMSLKRHVDAIGAPDEARRQHDA